MIYNEDCLTGMDRIADGSVDMILCDLPYGTTQCKWDVVIPFEELWKQYKRVIKENGAIVLTASQPFTSLLIASNLKMFKQELIWEKSSPTGFLNAKKQPLRSHENILVFYKKQPTYNPVKWQIDPIFQDRRKTFNVIPDNTKVYGVHGDKAKKIDDGWRLPLSVIPVKSVWEKGMHSTQKPVPLFAYLIRTYSNPNDLILDNCVGRGTTSIAAMQEGRRWIAFEKNKTEFDKASKRIEAYKQKAQLL